MKPWLKRYFEKRFLVARTIWLAFVVSQLFVCFLVFALIPHANNAPMTQIVPDLFAIMVFAITATLVIFSYQFLGRSFRKGINKARDEDLTADALRQRRAKGLPEFNEEDINQLMNLSENEKFVFRLMPNFIVVKFFQGIMCEVCGYVGLEMSLIKHNPSLILPYTALAMILLLTSRPSENQVLKSTVRFSIS